MKSIIKLSVAICIIFCGQYGFAAREFVDQNNWGVVPDSTSDAVSGEQAGSSNVNQPAARQVINEPTTKIYGEEVNERDTLYEQGSFEDDAYKEDIVDDDLSPRDRGKYNDY